jgi:hypothetical protein
VAAEELENAAEQLHPGLSASAAWPTLRGHLALLTLAGADPVAALKTAAAVGQLGSAHDAAAVLDWRLPVPGAAGPLPWLPGVPATLADDPHWGPTSPPAPTASPPARHGSPTPPPP